MMTLTNILAALKWAWTNRFLVVTSFLVLAVLSFYIYHLRSKTKLDSLERERAALSVALENEKKKLQSIVNNYNQIIQSRDELRKQIEQSQQDLDELRQKLFRENQGKKSLDELATKKPRLIENIINRAIEKTFKCFEILSAGGNC